MMGKLFTGLLEEVLNTAIYIYVQDFHINPGMYIGRGNHNKIYILIQEYILEEAIIKVESKNMRKLTKLLSPNR